MLITFFKTLVSKEQCSNEDVIASCSVCLDGVSSALPSTKNKYPPHVALQQSSRFRAPKWQRDPVIFPPLQCEGFLPKESHRLVSYYTNLTSDGAYRLSGEFVGLSPLGSDFRSRVCVIWRWERGYVGQGGSPSICPLQVASSPMRVSFLRFFWQTWFSLNNQFYFFSQCNFPTYLAKKPSSTPRNNKIHGHNVLKRHNN